jgi:ABC-type glycerol-3-phosphate transport system substrate-binding protein
MRLLAALALVATMLAACGERPQELSGKTLKGSMPAWDGPKTEFTVPGWTVGDRASWDKQMQARAQTMNEYQRRADGGK